MKFLACTRTLELMLGSCVTFIPDAVDPDALPPPVPAGTVVPLALRCSGVDIHASNMSRIMLAIEAASRTEIRALAPDGRRFRLTPRRPTEPAGYWVPRRGMSEWVVREEA